MDEALAAAEDLREAIIVGIQAGPRRLDALRGLIAFAAELEIDVSDPYLTAAHQAGAFTRPLLTST